MSKASHEFDEVEDDTTNSKNVYKDKNGSYFGGESMSKQNWKEELCLLKSIGSHENIVRFFICCTFDDSSIRKLTELCDASLEDYVEATKSNSSSRIVPFTQRYSDMKDDDLNQNHKNYFKPNSDNLPLCLDLLHQTAQGLKYLHDNNIIHRNIQPPNVYLTRTSQNKTVAKLGGFRYCKKESSENTDDPAREDTTALMYMASECHAGRWSKESDIFAFGILIYFTLTKGDHPYAGTRPSSAQNKKQTIVSNIKKQNNPNLKKQRLDSDKEKQETQTAIIQQLIDHEPKRRLTVDEALYHPTFYTPQRKLEFLLKVRESVKIIWTKKSHLLHKKIAAVLKNFKYDPEIVFQNHHYLIDEKPDVDEISGWQPLSYSCGSIKNLLNDLRNKVAHACDRTKDIPLEFRNDFGVTDDSFSHAKFLEIFVTNHFPKLLADLYNCYRSYNKTKKREERYAANFYP